ncbi:MAG: ABC transporter permease subunit [Chloroflexota bacterium]|jgi:ABC-2 type transport system permease protein|nr:ABC transporter permease subunit [Chloroflexota bacterium]
MMGGALMVLTRLSIRQLAGGKRMWLVLILAALPLVFAAIFALVDADMTPLEFSNGLTNELIASTILPLVMLVLAAASFGNELDDHTLPFLVQKPVARWRIVAAKLVAALLVGGVPVLVSAWFSTFVSTEGDAGHATVTIAALAVGTVAYATLFTWAGLAIRYALPFGIAYIFVWEAALSSFLGGTRFLSVRQYMLAIVRGLDEERLQNVTIELSPTAGLIGAALVTAVFIVLTIRRLDRTDIP